MCIVPLWLRILGFCGWFYVNLPQIIITWKGSLSSRAVPIPSDVGSPTSIPTHCGEHILIAVQIEKTGQKKDVLPIASLTVFPLNSKLIFPVLQLLFALFTAESGFSSFMWTKDQRLFLLNFSNARNILCVRGVYAWIMFLVNTVLRTVHYYLRTDQIVVPLALHYVLAISQLHDR